MQEPEYHGCEVCKRNLPVETVNKCPWCGLDICDKCWEDHACCGIYNEGVDTPEKKE